MHNAPNSALGVNPARDRAQPNCATNDREMGSSITLSGTLTIILSKNFPVDLFSEMEARTILGTSWCRSWIRAHQSVDEGLLLVCKPRSD